MEFKQDDIIVSLKYVEHYRNDGDIFKVCRDAIGCVYYLSNTNGNANSFRHATLSEIRAYNQGVKNINDIKQNMNYYFY